MAHPTAAPADVAGISTEAALTLLDRLADAPPDERRSLASRACRARRAELALYATLLAERDGRAPSLSRLELEDPIMRELLLLATA